MSEQTFGKVVRPDIAVLAWSVAVASVAIAFYISCFAVDAVFETIFGI